MARYIIIDAEGLIINAIEWDGVSDWTPPTDTTVELNDDNSYAIGGTLIDDVYTPPEEPA